MKLSEIQKKTRTLVLNFQGDTLEVEYRANVVTPAFLADNVGLVPQVREAVVRWDLLDDDGNEVEVAAIVNKLPYELLSKIVDAIIEDIRVNSEEKKG